VQGQEAPPQDDAITVLARGPVHEAFAEPAQTNPQPGPVVPKQPPVPVPEIPPDQKPEAENAQWIPGYWAWDADKQDFLWVSGTWRIPPPGRSWVPGHWSQVDGGWQWSPGLWAAAEQESLEYLAPPPDSLENGPSTDAPSEDSLYVPGLWVPRADQYWWRPGFWTVARPGWIWNPASYYWSPSGCIFNEGYWDYPLEDRGVLFAPVSFAAPLWSRPGWCFRPYYAVNVPNLLASFFVRPACSHYFFGDYYAAAYLSGGFQPWYAYGPRFFDPLFSYYRWHFRGDRAWLAGLRNTYWARRNEVWARPPRTLIEQNRLVQTNIRNTVAVAPHSLHMLTPLNQFAGNGIRLTSLSQAQLARQRTLARATRNLSVARTQAERHTAFAANRSWNHPGKDIHAGSFQLPLSAGFHAARSNGIRAAGFERALPSARPEARRPSQAVEATRSFHQAEPFAARNAVRAPAPGHAGGAGGLYRQPRDFRRQVSAAPPRQAPRPGGGHRAMYRPATSNARAAASHRVAAPHQASNPPHRSGARSAAPHVSRRPSAGHRSAPAAEHGKHH
jgi:hypothetical protein